MIFPDVAPWPATDEDSPHARQPGGLQVVVEAVPDIGDLAGAAWRGIDDRLKEPRIGLAHAQVVRRSDHVSWQFELAENVTSPRRLITHDAHPDPHVAQRIQARARVRVQVIFAERLRLPGFGAPLTLTIEIESGLKMLE